MHSDRLCLFVQRLRVGLISVGQRAGVAPLWTLSQRFARCPLEAAKVYAGASPFGLVGLSGFAVPIAPLASSPPQRVACNKRIFLQIADLLDNSAYKFPSSVMKTKIHDTHTLLYSAPISSKSVRSIMEKLPVFPFDCLDYF
jgi:hypothetical protein